MTPKELALQIEPEVKLLCQNMIPHIKQAVGGLKWLAVVVSFGITWKILTSHAVLPIIIQHALEYGVGKTQKYVKPMLGVVHSSIPLLESFLVDEKYIVEIKGYLEKLDNLYSISVSQLLPSVQASIGGSLTSDAQQMEFNFSSF